MGRIADEGKDNGTFKRSMTTKKACQHLLQLLHLLMLLLMKCAYAATAAALHHTLHSTVVAA